MVPLAKKWIFKNQRFVKLESMKTWIYGFVMLTGNEWNPVAWASLRQDGNGPITGSNPDPAIS